MNPEVTTNTFALPDLLYVPNGFLFSLTQEGCPLEKYVEDFLEIYHELG